MNGLRSFGHEVKKNWALFLMIMPAVIFVFIMSYVPMSGLVLAFKDYRYNLGVFASPWAKLHGFYNFKFLFGSGKGWIITRNTILYNVAMLFMSQAIGMVLAVCISEMYSRVYKRVVQSLVFLPYFVSWIIVGAFVQNIFNYETGVLNNTLTSLGMNPVNMYAIPVAWIFIIIFFHSWKSAGYNSILYIAAITNLDAECYEAADIDGANIWQRIWHITLPCLKPTVITILLLNLGGILRGDFGMFYNIIGNNGPLFDYTDVIDTYVFRSLASGQNMGMTAAAAFYQSIVCFVIINTVNAIVKRVEKDYALF